MTLIINAFQSRLEGTELDLRFSSSPQPATAQRFSAGLFWYAADGELAHRTTHAETARTTVRSWAVARSQGPPRAAPRCRKRSAAESRPPPAPCRRPLEQPCLPAQSHRTAGATTQPKIRKASTPSFCGPRWHIAMRCATILAGRASASAFRGLLGHITMLCEFRVARSVPQFQGRSDKGICVPAGRMYVEMM